jgi:hypothetical protein
MTVPQQASGTTPAKTESSTPATSSENGLLGAGGIIPRRLAIYYRVNLFTNHCTIGR